jgi:hypothetical protein
VHRRCPVANMIIAAGTMLDLRYERLVEPPSA